MNKNSRIESTLEPVMNAGTTRSEEELRKILVAAERLSVKPIKHIRGEIRSYGLRKADAYEVYAGFAHSPDTHIASFPRAVDALDAVLEFRKMNLFASAWYHGLEFSAETSSVSHFAALILGQAKEPEHRDGRELIIKIAAGQTRLRVSEKKRAAVLKAKRLTPLRREVWEDIFVET